MRRARLCVGIGVFLVCGVGAALAQGYNPAFNPYGQSQNFGPSQGEIIALRIAVDVITALIGFGVGAFFSPLLRPFRRIASLVALVAALLFAWIGPPPIADALAYLLAVFLFFMALGYGLRLGVKALAVSGRDIPTSFGSAKWATESYLRERGLFGQAGFLLGTFASASGKTPLFYTGARHLLTVAPTRSGKGVAAIIPNLLTYEGSVFIIDPKGENALVTADRRGPGNARRGIPGLGQSVFLLDPWDIAAGDLDLTPARFNPLDWITADDPDAAENAFLLADALVPEGAEGEGRFWDDEAKALLTGVILYVATSEKEAENRHLGRVRDILLLDDAGFKAVLQTMYNEPLPVIASTAARTAGKEVKLRSNVIATVQSHTHFFDSPRIRESLSASDFSFEDLKTKPTTVYLILPADRLKTFDRWLRLLIQQAITVNARNILIKPKKPVLFLLDEMASLGRLSMVEQAYGLMAGFGMQLWGIVQDLSQLERIYGDGWQTFISNSGVIQYFGSRDKITAEYFSTLCGVTTIRLFSFAYAIGKVFGTSSSGSGSGTSSSESFTHTTNSNESQRQLAYPDELMVLKDDAQIIFVENLDPISGDKVRWYEDARLRTLGVNLQAKSQPTAASQPAAAYAPVPPEPMREPVYATSRVADPVAETINTRHVDAAQPAPGVHSSAPPEPSSVPRRKGRGPWISAMAEKVGDVLAGDGIPPDSPASTDRRIVQPAAPPPPPSAATHYVNPRYATQPTPPTSPVATSASDDLFDSPVIKEVTRGDATYTLYEDGTVRMTSPTQTKFFKSRVDMQAYMNSKT